MDRDPERSFWTLPAQLRRRGLALFVGTTLYAMIAAVRANPMEPRRVWLAGLGALGIALLATRQALSTSEEVRSAPRPPLPGVSFATWGLALAVVSLAGADPEPGSPAGGSAWLFPLGTFGACLSALATCGSQASAPRRLGIAGSLPSPRDGVRVAGITWIAGGAALIAVASAFPRVLLAPSAREVRASVGGWFEGSALAALALVLAERLRATRLVVGDADRARAALGSVVGVFLVALAVLVVRAGEPAPSLRIALATGGLAASICASHANAIALARVGRRALTLGLFGGPVILLTVIASEGVAGTGATVAFLGGVAALTVGALGGWLEDPLRPAEGRWLDAFAAAKAELARSDPQTSTEGALRELRAPAGTSAESPELWSIDPMRVLTIDAAGYARERDAALPPQLLEVAAGEPEATIRTELLDALLVRRPDLRALARWMDERGALAATLITRDGEVFGVLVVPRGQGREPMTLEETHALKSLADAMSGACSAKSAFARSLQREQDATVRAETAELLLERGHHGESLAAGRLALEVAREMRGAEVGRYSPLVQFAQAALERRMSARAPIVVVGPAGLDPIPHLAAAHVAVARRPGTPFVVVDGTASPERDAARWRDPVASPLALAQGGLLVLADGAALPAEVQRLLAQALAERRAPWGEAEALDVAIALTATRPFGELVRASQIDPALATRFGEPSEAEVVLPPLEARPEDLRALLSDRLAREGLRQRGSPVGIDDAAFARLADYSFPGDVAELILVARRLVATVPGDVVRAADVDAIGLPPGGAPRVNVRASRAVS